MSEHTPWHTVEIGDDIMQVADNSGMEVVTVYPADTGELTQTIAHLIAAAPELLEALKAVEWVQNGGNSVWCAWCKQSPQKGHAADCQRQAALKLVGG